MALSLVKSESGPGSSGVKGARWAEILNHIPRSKKSVSQDIYIQSSTLIFVCFMTTEQRLI